MTAFEWIALVGAAAWLPQIGVGLYRLLARPRVILIPVPDLEVGYNFLGPILNMRATLFAERRDGIVLDMRAKLRHEKGREVHLVWHSFVEEFSQLQGKEESVKVSRDQDATALKLSTALPVEKLIRFQDPEFQRGSREITARADSELDRLTAGSAQGAETFLASQPYHDLVEYHRHNFCWEAGTYQIELTIRLLGRRTASMARGTFTLTPRDADRLRDNVARMEQRAEQIARGVPEEERVTIANWATPRLTDKNVMIKK